MRKTPSRLSKGQCRECFMGGCDHGGRHQRHPFSFRGLLFACCLGGQAVTASTAFREGVRCLPLSIPGAPFGVVLGEDGARERRCFFVSRGPGNEGS
jgi:hypothetical protein